MENWFLIYAYLSAGIVAIDFYHTLFKYKDGDNQCMEDIAMLADALRVDIRWLILLAFLLIAAFGWLILPVKVANIITNKIKGE